MYCDSRNVAVVRRGKHLMAMPYDKEKIESDPTLEKLWVGSPWKFFEEKDGTPRLFDGISADKLFIQMEQRMDREQEQVKKCFRTLDAISAALQGQPSTYVIVSVKGTIRVAKNCIEKIPEEDQNKYRRKLKDLFELEQQ